MTLTTFTVAGGPLVTETGCRLMIGPFTGIDEREMQVSNTCCKYSHELFYIAKELST